MAAVRQTSPHEILRDLQQAADQIPKHEQAAEAAPLVNRYQKCRRSPAAGHAAVGGAGSV